MKKQNKTFKNIRIIVMLGFILQSTIMDSQTILSQDFEGSTVGWSFTGVISTTQNSIVPVSGSKMVSLGASNYLETPNFTLPAGSKYVSFWLNSYYTPPMSYSITAILYQNNLQVTNLGNWQSDNLGWSQKVLNLPVGYTGDNYTVGFNVAPNGDGSLKFYIDDFEIAAGQPPVSIQENDLKLNEVSVLQDADSENKLVFKTLTYPLMLDLKLFDTEGKIIYATDNLEILSSEQNVKIPHVNEGLYLLSLQSDKKILTKKILLK